MVFTVHAGHAAPGKKYSGASGILDESTEARKIKDAVIKYLRQDGHTVYDCTVDSGTSQGDIIQKIKAKINSHSGVTANISIHLNSYNKKSHGTECLVYAMGTPAEAIGQRICYNIHALGYANRGVKPRTDLGVLKGITNGGDNVLIETFFCDEKGDCDRYSTLVGADLLGKIIAQAVLNKKITGKKEEIVMANVIQYTLDGGDKQKWKPEILSNGRIMLKNKYNGEYLDVDSGRTNDGTNVQTYKKNNSTAQQWIIDQLKNNYNPSNVAPFEIISALDRGKRLDVSGASKSNLSNIQLYKTNGGAAQRFSIIDTGDGYWCIVNTNSLKAISV